MSTSLRKTIKAHELYVIGNANVKNNIIVGKEARFGGSVILKKDSKLYLKKSQLACIPENVENVEEYIKNNSEKCDIFEEIPVQSSDSNRNHTFVAKIEHNYECPISLSENIHHYKDCDYSTIELSFSKQQFTDLFYDENEKKIKNKINYLRKLSDTKSDEINEKINLLLKKKINNSYSVTYQQTSLGGDLFHHLFDKTYAELVKTLRRIRKAHCSDTTFYANWLTNDTIIIQTILTTSHTCKNGKNKTKIPLKIIMVVS